MNILFWMSTSFQTTSRHLLISILDELIKSGNHVTVLKKDVGNITEELPVELQGKNIQCISINTAVSNKSNLIARYLNDIIYIHKCKKYLTPKYDAVFVQSSNVAGLVFKILRAKQSGSVKTFNVQDTFPQNAVFSGTLTENNIVYQSLKRIQSYAYRYADHIITISEDMKELLEEEYCVKPEKIEVVYNWSYVDDVFSQESFDIEAVSKIYKTDHFNVVYAGNIGVMQNVDIIIETAKLLKEHEDIWFNIIGNGVYREKLEKQAAEYGIKNISFLPFQSAEMAPSLYGCADVNIIPLKENVFKTALPSKTATCIACQKPVIFAIGKRSRFGQKVAKETGCLLVDSNNAEGIAKAIMSVRNNEVKVKTREYFLENMSKTKNSRKYAEIITRR